MEEYYKLEEVKEIVNEKENIITDLEYQVIGLENEIVRLKQERDHYRQSFERESDLVVNLTRREKEMNSDNFLKKELIKFCDFLNEYKEFECIRFDFMVIDYIHGDNVLTCDNCGESINRYRTIHCECEN